MGDNPLVPFIERYGAHQGGLGVLLFAHEVLGITMDKWQIDMLFWFGEGERGISVAACHGPGKTAGAAICIVYSLLFRFPLRAIATAPSRGQIEGAMMSEIVKWISKMPQTLQDLLDVKSMSVTLKRAPKRAYFEARTARPETPEALQGIHEDEGYVYLLVDEASGVHEKIFESAGGSMSGENCQTMLLSNPTKTSGFFFNTHHKEKDRWKIITISHEDSTRVTDAFVEDMALRYGRDSNTFRVRALGLFPRSDLDALISFESVQSSRDRDIIVPKHLGQIWGIDVARFGDDSSVLVKRNRIAVLPDIHIWDGLNTMQLSGRILELWKNTPDSQRPSEILVDVIGMGAGVVDRLQELNLPVRGINVSETAGHSELYRNLRTELWFECKSWIESRDHVLPNCPGIGVTEGSARCQDRQSCTHERLAAELTTLKYDLTSGGKYLAESKRDLKKRGYKSPDVADALMMTFAGEPATLTSGPEGWGGHSWNESISRDRAMV
jgi:hypothetical protein